MAGTAQISFLLNGAPVRVPDPDPSMMLLDYLRDERRLTGTKEGCREGDCGACTVAVVSFHRERLRARAVNACILFLPAVDGTAIFTVEGVAPVGGGFHPVQQSLVDRHGSQCGFCTPGFVMSMFAADFAGERPDRARIDELLAGNLCRCTGYGPIVAAAEASIGSGKSNAPMLADLAQPLSALQRESMLEIERRGGHPAAAISYRAPRSLAELRAALRDTPRATLLAGGTDLGLCITKQRGHLETIIDVTRVVELQEIVETASGLSLGAGVTYTDARAALANLSPEFDRLLSRVACEQIRNSGTIGGNIANGSPIGDMPPALMALGARIELIGADESRTLALEDFFLDYGRQDRGDGEALARIDIPRLAEGAKFRIYKITKRFDQDIASVCGAFHLVLREGVARDVRLCFGGMAATPRRAAAGERALEGRPFDEAGIESAALALAEDFSPLSDHRASARYRLLVAQNLLRKFRLESAGARVARLDREPVP